MTSIAYNLEDEESYLNKYLQNTTASSPSNENESVAEALTNDNEHHDADDTSIDKRVYCCKTSRSLYCPECCRVLVPRKHWPRDFIRQQRHRACSSFPFQSIDIVLGVKERRTSSTGIQMMCITNMIREATESTDKSEEKISKQQQLNQCSELIEKQTKVLTTSDSKDNGNIGCSDNCTDDKNGYEWWRNITLYDLNRGDELPEYSSQQKTAKLSICNTQKEHHDAVTKEVEEGTYVLFPQEGKSVPISSVANRIKRLVVLDIKWTRSYNVQLFSADHHKNLVSQSSEGGGGKSYNPLAPLKDLPFVHLEFPPQNSHFWRWHNRGVGMLSTIEALYFAAREVSVAQQQIRGIGEDDAGHNMCNDDKSFVDILWLFALQRSIIEERSLQEGRPVAFSEEAKAMARALRKQHLQK